jgi:hypothetical protein
MVRGRFRNIYPTSHQKSTTDHRWGCTSSISFFSLLLICSFARTSDPIAKECKVKSSGRLAYLYYLPFCSVFKSKDKFSYTAPLFLNDNQTFVNGIEFNNEPKPLNEYYSALSENKRKLG